jgi:hypothetical protein
MIAKAASDVSDRSRSVESLETERGLRAVIAAEKRKGNVDRRKQIDPTTCERDYSGDELEFMRAMDDYKRRNGRMFPTCSEILEVVRAIGYTKQSSTASSTLANIEQLASAVDRILE